MYFDLPFLISGDVLFYTSGKPHGIAIEAKQKSLGFANAELMHAAMMVDSRTLVEATTKNGVDFVPIFKDEETFENYRPAKILRHKEIATSARSTRDLWHGAYYFFKQKYDWVGALQRRLVSDKRKICSTLVHDILIKRNFVQDPSQGSRKFQVFPAELFNLFSELGFEEVDAFRLPRTREFGEYSDMTMLKLLEQNKRLDRQGWTIAETATKSHEIGELELVQLQIGSSTEKIIRLALLAAPYGGNSLIRFTSLIEDVVDSYLVLKETRANPVSNWSDEEAKLNSVERQGEHASNQLDLLRRQFEVLRSLIEDTIPEFLRELGGTEDDEVATVEAFFALELLVGDSDPSETPNTIKKLSTAEQELLQVAFEEVGTAVGNGVGSAIEAFRQTLLNVLDIVVGCINEEPERAQRLRFTTQGLAKTVADLAEQNLKASGLSVSELMAQAQSRKRFSDL